MLKNKNLIYKKVTNTLYLNWWMFLADSHQHFKEKIVICCVEWLTSCAFFVSQPRQPTIMGAAVLGYGCTSAVPPVSHVLLSVGSFWPGWQAFASSWRKTPGCSPNSYSLAASTHTRTASMEAKRSEAINTSAEFPQLLFHLQHFFLLLVFYFSSFYFFCLFLPIVPLSSCTVPKWAAFGFEGLLIRLSPVLFLSLSSSFTLPSLPSVRMHLLQCAVSGWLCIRSDMLSPSPATLPSYSAHRLTHSDTHSLWSLACPILLTSTGP